MKDQNLYLVGIDLAKNIFQLHGINREGEAILKKRVSRRKLVEEVGKLSKCIIAMEACSGAHYWGRIFKEMGHEVKLLNAREVKAYVRGNKTDAQDAEAIAEAGSRPRSREVGLKSEWQQVVLSLHKMRESSMDERTALGNRIRGLLAEFGFCLPKGLQNLERELGLELKKEDSQVPGELHEEFSGLLEDLRRLNRRIKKYDQRIKGIYESNEKCQRLGKVEGLGPITATALVAMVGNGSQFKNGRSFASYLGLTPREHSSGGKRKLLGISKRGNNYLRKQLVHGGRSLVRCCENKKSKRFRWIQAKKESRGYNKAAVAIANKNARIAWSLLSTGQEYKAA